MTGEATLSNEKNYIYRKLYVTHLDFDTKEEHDLVYCRYFLNINSILFEYSCAVTPQVRQTGNRLSGLAGTAYASLLA